MPKAIQPHGVLSVLSSFVDATAAPATATPAGLTLLVVVLEVVVLTGAATAAVVVWIVV
jgi:hypothetical protein